MIFSCAEICIGLSTVTVQHQWAHVERLLGLGSNPKFLIALAIAHALSLTALSSNEDFKEPSINSSVALFLPAWSGFRGVLSLPCRVFATDRLKQKETHVSIFIDPLFILQQIMFTEREVLSLFSCSTYCVICSIFLSLFRLCLIKPSTSLCQQQKNYNRLSWLLHFALIMIAPQMFTLYVLSCVLYSFPSVHTLCLFLQFNFLLYVYCVWCMIVGILLFFAWAVLLNATWWIVCGSRPKC